MRTAVRENRAFLGRAVRYLAGEAGITQFRDLGSGRNVDGGVGAYQQGGMPVRLRDGGEFADLAFKGLTLVPPSVVVVSEWRPEPGAVPPPGKEVGINGGVARKP